MNPKLKSGKVDPHILQKFFSALPEDNSVIVGPEIGEDAAIVDMDGRFLVVKTDPITFTSNNLGWYVVNINANDIACMGGVPRWFLVTVLLPPEQEEEFLHQFFNQLSHACRELGISLIGGHSEVTPAVSRPVAIGCMVGKISHEKIINNSRAKSGDVILLTKGIAIEGTHVIYQEKREELEKEIAPDILKRMGDFLKNPGISVVKEATLASASADVHCMHDPTEGGLSAGLWEIAAASGVGIRIKEENIPIFEETKLVCEKFNLNPLNFLASGALIIVTTPEDAEKLMSIYKDLNIRCAKIGEVLPKEKAISIIKKGGDVSYIFSPPKDELNKLL
ncbi:AIR synthase family protein [Candidatus Aerophobetes bacterium]|nr:AIR synthase family protein [Candidatus Aerophobetes bacterium]